MACLIKPAGHIYIWELLKVELRRSISKVEFRRSNFDLENLYISIQRLYNVQDYTVIV